MIGETGLKLPISTSMQQAGAADMHHARPVSDLREAEYK